MERRIAFVFCITGVLVFLSVVTAQDPRGTPGVDYPNYFTIPDTSFKCAEQKYNPGFYADLETKCQAFHFCYQDRQESFLCPTGTIFNQAVLTCDVWHKSNCSLAQMFYSVNAGPIMERAGKNLPMLLRLRNSSQKTFTQTSNSADEVSALHDTNETPENSKDSELKTMTNEKSVEVSRDVDKNDKFITDHKLDSEKDASEETKDELSDGQTEDMSSLVYDRVEDGYRRNNIQYEEEWQNSDPINEEFGNFYGYSDPDNEYGTYTGEYQNDYINKESKDSGYQFTKRSQQSHSRLRRKPIYVLDQPVVTEKRTETDLEFDTSVKGETREGKQMNPTESAEEATPSPTPFPRPTAIPHSLLNISTDTPLTSEEFESAIWSDLIIPDDYEGTSLLVSTNPETSVQSDGTSQYDVQSEDETIYIENDMEPENYVPYISQYKDAVVVPEPDEAYSDFYPESQEQEETIGNMDDTFVVIPDEYNVDSVSNEDFEIRNYPGESNYRSEMLQGHSPIAGYSTYENTYDYNGGYPQHYQQADMYNGGYPQHYQQADMYNSEVAAGIYRGAAPNDEMYGYESRYEVPYQTRINYEASGLEAEDTYTQSGFYPYEETGLDVAEKPLQLPVAEAGIDGLSGEDFVYVLDDQPEADDWQTAGIEDNIELGSLDKSGTREGKQMNPTSESVEEATPSPEPFPRPTAIPHSLLNISSETPMTSEEFESAIWSDLIIPGIPDDYEGTSLLVNPEASAQSDGTNQSDAESEDETIYIRNDMELADSDTDSISSAQESDQTEDVYYVLDFDEGESSKSNEIKMNENTKLEESLEKSEVDEQKGESKLSNSSDKSSASKESLVDKKSEPKIDGIWSSDEQTVTKDELSKSAKNSNPMNKFSSNLGRSQPMPFVSEASFPTNMGNLDYSTDSRFLNDMGYSESMDFGPYGFGPNIGQLSMIESMQQSGVRSPFSQRVGQTEQPKISPLSAIQEKMRSMKQGKFGAFKKYMSSTRNV